MFVATKTSSRQAYFCSDKRRVLSRQTHVWQKHMFVATKGFHETPIKEHLANFAMVRHGNKQKKQKKTTTKNANAYNRKKKERTTVVKFALFQKVITERFTENVVHTCV